MKKTTIRQKARRFCGCPEAGISCSTTCKDSCCVARERYVGFIAGYEASHSRLHRFAGRVYFLLGVKALRGCQDASWEGFCNGNGTNIGQDMEALVKTAHKLTKQYGTPRP